jgi:hypothetical protein
VFVAYDGGRITVTANNATYDFTQSITIQNGFSTEFVRAAILDGVVDGVVLTRTTSAPTVFDRLSTVPRVPRPISGLCSTGSPPGSGKTWVRNSED